ncbi:hypothetical protein CRG98_030266 [Punica granatum]|uniref:Uncharacterized protein n=1 Tax=Punica granatum TaxID=22663 RepID=A0A2I0IZA8_PUNGR|nr:hypothetical protein CRG98_030266 [Punica granatum]
MAMNHALFQACESTLLRFSGVPGEWVERVCHGVQEAGPGKTKAQSGQDFPAPPALSAVGVSVSPPTSHQSPLSPSAPDPNPLPCPSFLPADGLPRRPSPPPPHTAGPPSLPQGQAPPPSQLHPL